MLNKSHTYRLAFVQFVVLITLLALPIGLALAAPTTPAAPPATSSGGTNQPVTATNGVSSILKEVGGKTSLPSFESGHPDQNYQPGISNLTSIIYFGMDFFKYIFGGIAVLMLVISGIKLVIAGRGVAEVMNREKETIRFASSGIIIILIADPMIRYVFFGQEGEVYRTAADMQMAAEQGSNIVMSIAGILRIFIPSLAILYFVIAGVRLLFSGGNADAQTKSTKQITWAIIGIMVTGLAEILIYRIIFPNFGLTIPNTGEMNKLVVQMTNYVSGFVSTISITMLIYSGYLYVTSLGGAGLEKAKKVLIGAVVGLIIAMAAFAIVNTFIKLEPLTGSETTTQNVPIPGT